MFSPSIVEIEDGVTFEMLIVRLPNIRGPMEKWLYILSFPPFLLFF